MLPSGRRLALLTRAPSLICRAAKCDPSIGALTGYSAGRFCCPPQGSASLQELRARAFHRIPVCSQGRVFAQLFITTILSAIARTDARPWRCSKRLDKNRPRRSAYNNCSLPDHARLPQTYVLKLCHLPGVTIAFEFAASAARQGSGGQFEGFRRASVTTPRIPMMAGRSLRLNTASGHPAAWQGRFSQRKPYQQREASAITRRGKG